MKASYTFPFLAFNKPQKPKRKRSKKDSETDSHDENPRFTKPPKAKNEKEKCNSETDGEEEYSRSSFDLPPNTPEGNLIFNCFR